MPIAADIREPSIGIFTIKFAILSSPIAKIIVLIIKLITNIYANICTVCFMADFNIPSSSQLQFSSSHILCISIMCSLHSFFSI